MKYKWIKKYSKEEAETQIECTCQMITSNRECIWTWEKQIKYWKCDKLIEALCKQTTQEMIEKAEEQNLYLLSKLEYMNQFTENYIIKWSFWIPIY